MLDGACKRRGESQWALCGYLRVSGPQIVRIYTFCHINTGGNTFLALYVFICEEMYLPRNLDRSGSELRASKN